MGSETLTSEKRVNQSNTFPLLEEIFSGGGFFCGLVLSCEGVIKDEGTQRFHTDRTSDSDRGNGNPRVNDDAVEQ